MMLKFEYLKKLKISNLVVCSLLLLALSSCGWRNVRESLGVAVTAPDEFLVERNDPLEIPEDFTLPTPGSKTKISSSKRTEEASEILFGGANLNTKKSEKLSAIESDFVENVGEADENIRETIKEEYEDNTSVFGVEKGGMAEKILDPFGYNRSTPQITDGAEENKRIREAIASGEEVNAEDAKTKYEGQ